VRGRTFRPAVWSSPHADASVTVVVGVPAATPAGDYLSGIAVQSATAPAEYAARLNLAVSSIVRCAVGPEVQTPGPRHPQVLLTVASQERPAGLAFLLDARNSGNVILKTSTARSSSPKAREPSRMSGSQREPSSPGHRSPIPC
jgi:hypothetical protein